MSTRNAREGLILNVPTCMKSGMLLALRAEPLHTLTIRCVYRCTTTTAVDGCQGNQQTRLCLPSSLLYDLLLFFILHVTRCTEFHTVRKTQIPMTRANRRAFTLHLLGLTSANHAGSLVCDNLLCRTLLLIRWAAAKCAFGVVPWLYLVSGLPSSWTNDPVLLLKSLFHVSMHLCLSQCSLEGLVTFVF